MWTRDDADPRVVEHGAADLARLGSAPGAHWAAGELAVWLVGSGAAGRPDPPRHAARGVLAGRHRDAATWWQDRGTRPGSTLPDRLGRSDDRHEGLATIESLGAAGTLARLAALLPVAQVGREG